MTTMPSRLHVESYYYTTTATTTSTYYYNDYFSHSDLPIGSVVG